MNAIDIHVHHRWTKLDQRPDYPLERTRSLARQSGIDKVLLLTGGARSTPEQLRERNDCTLKLMEWASDFFLPAMYLCAEHGANVIKDEARRCVEAGMVAIKQSSGQRASDEDVDLIAEAAAELDIPILFHGWGDAFKVAHTEALERAAFCRPLAGRQIPTQASLMISGMVRRFWPGF